MTWKSRADGLDELNSGLSHFSPGFASFSSEKAKGKPQACQAVPLPLRNALSYPSECHLYCNLPINLSAFWIGLTKKSSFDAFGKIGRETSLAGYCVAIGN